MLSKSDLTILIALIVLCMTLQTKAETGCDAVCTEQLVCNNQQSCAIQSCKPSGQCFDFCVSCGGSGSQSTTTSRPTCAKYCPNLGVITSSASRFTPAFIFGFSACSLSSYLYLQY